MKDRVDVAVVSPSVVVASSASDPAAPPAKESWRVQLGLAQTEVEIDAILAAKMAASLRLTELDCLFCARSFETFEVYVRT